MKKKTKIKKSLLKVLSWGIVPTIAIVSLSSLVSCDRKTIKLTDEEFIDKSFSEISLITSSNKSEEEFKDTFIAPGTPLSNAFQKLGVTPFTPQGVNVSVFKAAGDTTVEYLIAKNQSDKSKVKQVTFTDFFSKDSATGSHTQIVNNLKETLSKLNTTLLLKNDFYNTVFSKEVSFSVAKLKLRLDARHIFPGNAKIFVMKGKGYTVSFRIISGEVEGRISSSFKNFRWETPNWKNDTLGIKTRLYNEIIKHRATSNTEEQFRNVEIKPGTDFLEVNDFLKIKGVNIKQMKSLINKYAKGTYGTVAKFKGSLTVIYYIVYKGSDRFPVEVQFNQFADDKNSSEPRLVKWFKNQANDFMKNLTIPITQRQFYDADTKLTMEDINGLARYNSAHHSKNQILTYLKKLYIRRTKLALHLNTMFKTKENASFFPTNLYPSNGNIVMPFLDNYFSDSFQTFLIKPIRSYSLTFGIFYGSEKYYRFTVRPTNFLIESDVLKAKKIIESSTKSRLFSSSLKEVVLKKTTNPKIASSVLQLPDLSKLLDQLKSRNYVITFSKKANTFNMHYEIKYNNPNVKNDEWTYEYDIALIPDSAQVVKDAKSLLDLLNRTEFTKNDFMKLELSNEKLSDGLKTLQMYKWKEKTNNLNSNVEITVSKDENSDTLIYTLQYGRDLYTYEVKVNKFKWHDSSVDLTFEKIKKYLNANSSVKTSFEKFSSEKFELKDNFYNNLQKYNLNLSPLFNMTVAPFVESITKKAGSMGLDYKFKINEKNYDFTQNLQEFQNGLAPFEYGIKINDALRTSEGNLLVVGDKGSSALLTGDLATIWNNKLLKKNDVYAATEDSNGVLWLAGKGGLIQSVKKDGTVIHSYYLNKLSSNLVNKMLFTGNNNVRFVGTTNQGKLFNIDNKMNVTFVSNNKFGLSDVQNIIKSKNNGYWLISKNYDVVFVDNNFNLISNKFQIMDAAGMFKLQINDAFEDANTGQLVVATDSGSLYTYDNKGRFVSSDDLENNSGIYSFIKNGNVVYYSTLNGYVNKKLLNNPVNNSFRKKVLGNTDTVSMFINNEKNSNILAITSNGKIVVLDF